MIDQSKPLEASQKPKKRRKRPGTPSPGGRVTLQTIAEQAQVTVSTVSRILSDQGDNYAEATCKKIRAIAKRLKYRPNALIRGVQTGRTDTVALILAPVGSFNNGILHGVHQVLSEHNMAMLLDWNTTPGHGTDSERRMIHRMIDRCVDGFLLLRTHFLHSLYIQEILGRNIPLVVVDCELEPQQTDFVGTDDHQGGRAAAEHLLSLGHQRLLFVGNSKKVITSRRREAGFREVLSRSLGAAGDWVNVSPRHEAARLVCERLRRADAPTGIFCYNDGYAEAVARAVLEAGFRIPHDVSLVGFGNETETHGEVPLTTFDQHPVEIGKVAARLYLDRVESTNGDADGTIQRKLIPADLVVRASTAAPR